MTYQTLKTEREGPLMTVRLNRPERRNAINRQMPRALQAVCRALAEAVETRGPSLPGWKPKVSLREGIRRTLAEAGGKG